MKKLILLLIVIISFYSCNNVEKNTKSWEYDGFTIAVDTTNIRIGEQLYYKIIANKKDKILFPKLELESLELVEDVKIKKTKDKLIKKYIITGFDSGAFYIPQQKISINDKQILTDSLLINVGAVKINKEITEFDSKLIQKEPYTIKDFMHLWWIVAIILLIILAIIYFKFFHKKNPKVKKEAPKLPPYEFAMEQLKVLDEKLLWQNNKVKEYYSELTDILRCFIENEFGVQTFESTSDEIVKKLSRLHRKKEVVAPNESLKKLKRLLQTSDLVKFAKSKPLADEIEQDRKDAEHIINNLKPKQEEVIEDENIK